MYINTETSNQIVELSETFQDEYHNLTGIDIMGEAVTVDQFQDFLDYYGQPIEFSFNNDKLDFSYMVVHRQYPSSLKFTGMDLMFKMERAIKNGGSYFTLCYHELSMGAEIGAGSMGSYVEVKLMDNSPSGEQFDISYRLMNESDDCDWDEEEDGWNKVGTYQLSQFIKPATEIMDEIIQDIENLEG